MFAQKAETAEQVLEVEMQAVPVCLAVIRGRAEMVERIRHKLNHYGGSLDPHACFLLHRGLKTLALRVRHQNQSALRIAQFLQSSAAVEKVNYPGLESHAGHERAKRWFEGFGGMLSFELEGGEQAAETLANLRDERQTLLR